MKEMRIWLGQQRKGAVLEGKWNGAEPLWNIGIHIKSNEVQEGLKISAVEKAIVNALKGNFASYKLVISPKAKEGLEGKHDTLSSFPKG